MFAPNTRTGTIMLACLIVLALPILLGQSHTISHTCKETGSYQKTVRNVFAQETTSYHASWIETRARKLGVYPSHPEWVLTQHARDYVIIESHRHHQRAPASYDVRYTEIFLEDYDEATIDAFTVEFITTTEIRRKEMIKEFHEGTYSAP